MRQLYWISAVLVVAALTLPGSAPAQSSSPEGEAAAKELIEASRMSEQMNQVLPQIMQQLKPLITKGSPQVERDFDAIMPLVMQLMNTHMDGFVKSAAQIYARHFTAEEMREVTAFYRRPTGQKLLQKLPQVMQETGALGQQLGQTVAQDLQKRAVEELRKRGHNI
jgi:uncharacterized protein